jgi:hypothetical protein
MKLKWAKYAVKAYLYTERRNANKILGLTLYEENLRRFGLG